MYYTTLASVELMMWRALEAYGCDPKTLFIKAGLDPDKLHHPGSRYSARSTFRLWEMAREETGDPCLGLKVAGFWHPSAVHALGFAWLASTTLEEAFQRLVRYYRVVTDLERLTFEEFSDAMRLSLHELKPESPATDEMYDSFFATITMLCRSSYGEHLNPLRVCMRHPVPGQAQAFRDFHRAPVRYGANEDAIYFGKAEVCQALPTANAELAHASDQIIARYMAHLDRTHMSMRVKAELIDRLPSGNATQQVIADALHVSLRTLQRRLAEEGTTYSSVLDETRSELATQHVKWSQLSIKEIGFLLGFSEPSNFARAFKRWTGVAPAVYRGAETGGND